MDPSLARKLKLFFRTTRIEKEGEKSPRATNRPPSPNRIKPTPGFFEPPQVEKSGRKLPVDKQNPATYFDPPHPIFKPVELASYQDDIPDRLKCMSCGHMLQEPTILQCGDILCPSCTLKYADGCCPLCGRDFVTSEVRPDARIWQRLQEIGIKCPNYEGGCDWEGPYKDLAAHLRGCEHEVIQCRYSDRGCTFASASRTERTAHLLQCPYRDSQCLYCGKPMYFYQRKDHETVCEKKPVECESCHNKYPRCNLSDHLIYECGSVVMNCPIKGCTFKGKRSEVIAHIQENLGDHMVKFNEEYRVRLSEILKTDMQYRVDTFLHRCGMGFSNKLSKIGEYERDYIDPSVLPRPGLVAGQLAQRGHELSQLSLDFKMTMLPIIDRIMRLWAFLLSIPENELQDAIEIARANTDITENTHDICDAQKQRAYAVQRAMINLSKEVATMLSKAKDEYPMEECMQLVDDIFKECAPKTQKFIRSVIKKQVHAVLINYVGGKVDESSPAQTVESVIPCKVDIDAEMTPLITEYIEGQDTKAKELEEELRKLLEQYLTESMEPAKRKLEAQLPIDVNAAFALHERTFGEDSSIQSALRAHSTDDQEHEEFMEGLDHIDQLTKDLRLRLKHTMNTVNRLNGNETQNEEDESTSKDSSSNKEQQPEEISNSSSQKAQENDGELAPAPTTTLSPDTDEPPTDTPPAPQDVSSTDSVSSHPPDASSTSSTTSSSSDDVPDHTPPSPPSGDDVSIAHTDSELGDTKTQSRIQLTSPPIPVEEEIFSFSPVIKE